MLYILGEDLATWLTDDPALQHLLTDLLPMFGLGNATLTIGTMSWTLLGAQGRYRLATVIVGIVSWAVSLPMGAICSVWLKVSLEGQTAAVVIGYTISGGIHAYFLFRSDWVALSKSVMDDNDSRASDDSVMNTPDVPAPSTGPKNEGEESVGVRVGKIAPSGIAGHWAESTGNDKVPEIEIAS